MKRLISILAIVLLSACSTVAPTNPPASADTTVVGTTNVQAEQIVFAAKQAYLVALASASVYQDWPKCSATQKILCRDDAIFAQIQKAGRTTSTALDAAEAAVRTPVLGTTARDRAVQTAQAALAAMTTILTSTGAMK